MSILLNALMFFPAPHDFGLAHQIVQCLLVGPEEAEQESKIKSQCRDKRRGGSTKCLLTCHRFIIIPQCHQPDAGFTQSRARRAGFH